MRKPTTAEDWMQLEFEIRQLFDRAPIDEEEIFAGITGEVSKILEAVLTRSKHVVLYGERGVGKTSLSNVFWKRYNKTLLSFIVAKIQAGPQSTFSSLWIDALDELEAVGFSSGKAEYVDFRTEFDAITPSQVRRELQKCGANALPILIMDEFNEVIDAEARRLTANLIKELYDFALPAIIILVGVAENVSGLIQDHASIDRALIQVPLNRMSNIKLNEIIHKRASRTVMIFSADAVWTIVTLSRGLPYFTQTLGKHAALHAIAAKRIRVEVEDVEKSMASFIEEIERLFRDKYREATRSNQENFFQQSILACALARTDQEGFFTANDVVDPYSAIMKDKKRIAHFEKHLRRIASDEGGNILIKRGGDRQQTFRFADPIMQPYVIIRGIQSRMIDDAAKAFLLQREQGVLSI